MPKRISTARFQQSIGRVSKMLSDDDRNLYVIVENRKEPDRSLAVLNIKFFAALLNTCEDDIVAEEARLVRDILTDVKERTSRSYRDRVMCRYEKD